MMRKVYEKPSIMDSSYFQGIVPLAAIGVALGGPAALTAAASAFAASTALALASQSKKGHINEPRLRNLLPIYNEE
jgi:hypothetical protein